MSEFKDRLTEKLKEQKCAWAYRPPMEDGFINGAKATLEILAQLKQEGYDKWKENPHPEGTINIGPLFDEGTINIGPLFDVGSSMTVQGFIEELKELAGEL